MSRTKAAKYSLLPKLLDAALEMEERADDYEKAFMARQLVQCTLPHSNPGDTPIWTRTNGWLTLAIKPHFDLKTKKPLYPYGTIPRLLLFWIVTEANRQKNDKTLTAQEKRVLRLGSSLDAFMRDIGLSPLTGGGKRGDAKRLRNQAERLFRSEIIFDERNGGVTYEDMKVAPRGYLFWEAKRSGQQDLLPSWVQLGESFYEAITERPVPIDTRALRALKQSPLTLDLYALLVYKTFAANRRKEKGLDSSQTIPWEGLHRQMGTERDLALFKFKVRKALPRIRLVYRGVNVEATGEGLRVGPGKTPIPPATLDGELAKLEPEEQGVEIIIKKRS